MHHSDNKLVQDICVVLSRFFFAERGIYAILSTNGCFDLAEVKHKFSKDFRDFKEIGDIRERNAKVLQGIEPCRTFFRA